MRGMAMSKRKEKISAFLDDDLHRDELMSFSLSGEAEDAGTAQRYNIIGDALRGELSDASFVDVSSAIREALADESIAEVVSSKTVTSSESPGLFDMSAWFKPVAGLAFAVMVAVVMVFTVSEQEGEGVSPVAKNTDSQSAIEATTVPVDDSAKSTKPLAAQANGAQPNTDINPYIDQHLEFATQDALQGRLPYVRAVSYETKKVE